MLALPGFEVDHRLGGIEAVVARLRLDRVEVGRKGVVLHHDLVARPGGTVERDEEEVQVGGQRAHRHHFDGFGAEELSELFGEEVLVPEPGVPRVEVAFDAEVGPVFELVDEVVLRGARLQAEELPVK